MLVYVRAREWWALAAVGLLLVVCVLWGIFGSVESVVHGQGILLHDTRTDAPKRSDGAARTDVEGALLQVVSPGAGRLSRLLIAADDRVAEGQTVAIIEQPELTDRISEAERKLDLLRAWRSALSSDASTDIRPDLRKDLLEADMRIVTEETQLATLRGRLDTTSTVEAIAGGRVLELLRTPGQLLREGDPILTLDVSDGTSATPAGERLRVQAFVHPGPGRTIREGMDAYVAPSFVRRDEFGLLIGRVTKVSRFPASPEGMQSVLGNPETVRALMNGGAPFAVTIELLSADAESVHKGPGNDSYRWTSRRDPGFALRSGTPCDVSVVVRRRRPAELVLPFLGHREDDVGGSRP